MRKGGTCSGGPVTRCGEAVPLGHDDGGNAQDAHDGEVDEAGLGGAVEGVVEPRHEGAHDEQSDARVVQSEETGGKERKEHSRLLGLSNM